MAKDFWDYSQGSNENHGSPDNYITVSESGVVSEGLNAFMAKVFGWMFFGLLITAGAAFAFIVALLNSEAVQNIAFSRSFMTSIIVAVLVTVIAISRGLRKISKVTARMLFVLYAALNGVTFSYICLMYAGTTITLAFIMTAVFFGIMALYGYTTKADLTKFGPILFAGLITLIIMTLVNFFMKSPMMDYIICLAGLGIFAGLTAYDVKKIKSVYHNAAIAGGGEMAAKLSIIGALALYLDFINMFLYLLRLMGKKK